MAFVAGILNPILELSEFKKLETQKVAPKMRQKLQVLFQELTRESPFIYYSCPNINN